jgi:hypothetical protein
MRNPYWLTVLLLAGCSDSTDPIEPPRFVVTPIVQWSGGEIRVRSNLFVGRSQLPRVTAAGTTMAVSRIDDSTLAATLPVLSSQVVPIAVVDGSDSYNLISVSVVGYQAHRVASSILYGEPSILMSPTGPVAVASLQSGTELGILDAATGLVRIETGVHPSDPYYGVGVSPDPAIAILRDSTQLLGRWRLWPTLQFIDTVLSGFQTTYIRQMVQLSDSVWLKTSSHMTETIRASAPSIFTQTESPWGFHLSSIANRALMDVNAANPGVPVFDMLTGDTVYRLSLNAVEGGVFTQDGGTLFAVGGYSISPNRLVAVNAASGAELNDVLLPDSVEASGMVLSGDTLLFVMGMADSLPLILVYEVGHLELRGRLSPPPTVACSTCGANMLWTAALIIDPTAGVLHVINTSTATEIWTFDLGAPLPPPPAARR